MNVKIKKEERLELIFGVNEEFTVQIEKNSMSEYVHIRDNRTGDTVTNIDIDRMIEVLEEAKGLRCK